MQMFMKFPVVIRLLILVFLMGTAFNLAYYSVSRAEEMTMGAKDGQRGMQLFKVNCSGCHLNGQNLIKPDKPIVGSGMIKSKKSFQAFISEPHPPMPNFKNIAMKPNQLDALYSYVTSLMGK